MGLLEELAPLCPVSEPGPQDQVDGMMPQVVARPRSTSEVSALLRAAHERSLVSVARGLGSKLSWGAPPRRLDILVDTSGLDELVEHATGDLIATAGAGMPLARLNEIVGAAGHQLVVDDLAGGSSLGGAIATNLSGPRRMWAGAIRDLVLGVTFVRADGVIAKAGGKVVKNVAGYDLAKLLTGSSGTLAIITEATVRLHPVPRASHWVLASVSPSRLPDALATAVHSQLVPHAVEVHTSADGQILVGVLISGSQAGAGERAQAMAAALSSAGGQQVQVEDQTPSWWGRHPVLPSPGSDSSAPSSLLLKLTSRLSGIPTLVSALQEAGQEFGLSLTGSAGVGVLYARLAHPELGDPPDPSAPHLAAIVQQVDRLRTLTRESGGSTVVLDADAQLKAHLDLWGPVNGLEIMRRIKTEFDPGKLLAPGRFVGGL